jgi:protocatechuate 3,4-dioxygenase beta subunit
MDAANNAPLAAAEIVVSRVGAAEPPLVLTTDAGGRYSVDDLEPGSYSVMSEKRGYLDRVFGQRGRTIHGPALRCDSGKDLADVDFHLIATGVITGRVLGEDNLPRIKADVQAFSPQYVSGERRLIVAGHASTNDLGEYRIYGLSPGRYFVSTSEDDPHGHQVVRRVKGAPPEEEYIPTLYPGASSLDRALSVDVPSGGEAQGIDIIALKSRSFHIRGKLMGWDPANHSTRIQLTTVGTQWSMNGAVGDIAPDTRGNFEFSGVTPGSYIVSTILPHNGSFESAWRLVDVVNADASDVSLAPSPGMQLRGRVRIEGDQKIDLSRLTVDLANSYAHTRPMARVKSDGSFLLYGVGPYSYHVSVNVLPEDFYLEAVRLGDQDVPGTSIDLDGTQATGELEMVLSGKGGRVDGVVRDENGQPFGGATVVLVPASNRREESDLFKELLADQNGHFTLRGIRPGEYKLFAWDQIEPGAWWDPEFMSRYEGQGVEIKIEASTDHYQDLNVIASKPE